MSPDEITDAIGSIAGQEDAEALSESACGVPIVILAEGETVTSVSRLLAMDFG